MLDWAFISSNFVFCSHKLNLLTENSNVKELLESKLTFNKKKTI